MASLLIEWSTVVQAAPTSTVLYEFPGNTGRYPDATPIINKNDEIFGTLRYGADGNGGAAYKLTPPPSGQSSWIETTLVSFPKADEAFPDASLLIGSNGFLFGTTAGSGGVEHGTVFRIRPPNKTQADWRPTILHKFTGGADGRGPHSGLIGEAGTALFGTTSPNVTPHGTVFSVVNAGASKGWTYTVIAEIGSAGTLVMDSSGALYGVGVGGVFKLNPPIAPNTKWTSSIIIPSGTAQNFCPIYNLTRDSDNNLYGISECNINEPSIFDLAPPKNGQTNWTKSNLYSFTFNQSNIPAMSNTANLIIDNAGSIYGITNVGGATNNGMVFKLTPPSAGQTTWTNSIYYSFPGGQDGSGPSTGGFNADSAGNFYYALPGGGSSGMGSIIELSH